MDGKQRHLSDAAGGHSVGAEYQCRFIGATLHRGGRVICAVGVGGVYGDYLFVGSGVVGRPTPRSWSCARAFSLDEAPTNSEQ